jgi:hypothetical protein
MALMPIYDQACGRTGWHFLREGLPVDCTVEMVDDGRDEVTFLILDKDGTDKELVVDEQNRAEAYDSWRLVWEKQQSEKK